MIDKIKKLIQDGKMDAAITSCSNLDVPENTKNEIAIIASQFESIERGRRIGTIDTNYYEKELNRIRNSILEILSKLEVELFESTSVIFDGTDTINVKHLEDSKHFQKLNRRINNLKYFKDKLSIKDGPTIFPPELASIGKYKLNEVELQRADEIKREIKKKIDETGKGTNDICAAVLKPPYWEDNPLYIEYHPMFYSEIKALREQNKKVAMYTANGVIFCEETNSILLHRRSTELSDDHKGTIHIFGGAFMPPNFGQPGDIDGAIGCLVREIQEETGFTFELSDETPTITLDEFSIDFIHTAFLGISISKKVKERPKKHRDSNEGHVIEVKFDDLEKCLRDIKSWTPAGWIDVVYWLALDTPNLRNKLKFSGKTGRELADDLLDFVEDNYG